MEKMIWACCQLHDIISFIILDLFPCFILFMIMRWIESVLENLSSLRPTLVLQFMLSYLLDKLCPKYITLILSYIYITTCKFIFLKSIPKIVFSLLAKYRGKTILGMAAFLLTISFLQKPSAVNYYYLKYLAYFGLFTPQSNINPCSVVEENSMNCSRQEVDVDIKNVKLTLYDQKIVMQILGQSTKEEEDQIDEHMIMSYEEFYALFEDSEPSLDEIQEAFSIFDQDRDGFIDARDLQIVLSKLGLGRDINLSKCQHMIEQHDRGGDGKISPNDFSVLLETSFL